MTRRGFTLFELVFTLFVAGLLMTLLATGVFHAREAARQAACAANLGQLATAALAYAGDHRGEFPWGMRYEGSRMQCWDFRWTSDGRPVPGSIWDGLAGEGASRVLQCPSYAARRSGGWMEDPYTGYNYNCSYIGKCEGDSGSRRRPATLAQVRNPARTALFGDGQYAGSAANKFMRAPVREKAHDGSGNAVRDAGTQGFRHLGRTNVAFCDGHVEALSAPYRRGGPGWVSPNCAFLSPDNALYSLEKAAMKLPGP